MHQDYSPDEIAELPMLKSILDNYAKTCRIQKLTYASFLAVGFKKEQFEYEKSLKTILLMIQVFEESQYEINYFLFLDCRQCFEISIPNRSSKILKPVEYFTASILTLVGNSVIPLTCIVLRKRISKKILHYTH